MKRKKSNWKKKTAYLIHCLLEIVTVNMNILSESFMIQFIKYVMRATIYYTENSISKCYTLSDVPLHYNILHFKSDRFHQTQVLMEIVLKVKIEVLFIISFKSRSLSILRGKQKSLLFAGGKKAILKILLANSYSLINRNMPWLDEAVLRYELISIIKGWNIIWSSISPTLVNFILSVTKFFHGTSIWPNYAI